MQRWTLLDWSKLLHGDFEIKIQNIGECKRKNKCWHFASKFNFIIPYNMRGFDLVRKIFRKNIFFFNFIIIFLICD